jgi:WD40 repeat protein
VFQLACVPGSKLLVSGHGNGTVRIWNIDGSQLEETSEFGPFRKDVGAIAVSADGKLLAVGAGRGRWGPADDTEEFCVKLMPAFRAKEDEGSLLPAHPGFVISMAFSPAEKLLAAGGYRGTTILWDLSEEAPRKRARLCGPEGIVEAMAFSPDGFLLATSNSLNGNWGSPGPVQLWNTKTGTLVREFDAQQAGMIRVMQFSPDGQTLATGSHDGTIRLWSRSSRSAPESVTLQGSQGPIWSLAFSPDGKQIASGGSDGTVRVWDLEAASELYRLSGHEGMVYGVVFVEDEYHLISGGADGLVRRWELPEPPVRVLQPRESRLGSSS